MLLTRSPLEYPRKGLSARLACVKHAASVRPEPGSNSPTKKPSDKILATKNVTKKPQQHPQQNPGMPTGHKNKKLWHWHHKHPVKFSKNNHTPHPTPPKRPDKGQLPHTTRTVSQRQVHDPNVPLRSCPRTPSLIVSDDVGGGNPVDRPVHCDAHLPGSCRLVHCSRSALRSQIR